MRNEREYMAACAVKAKGDWAKTAALLKKNQDMDVRVEEPYITCLDPCYPEELKRLRYPPWVLFYRGDIRLLARPKASIVGSRDMNEEGRANTILASEILSSNFVIVSGLAKGVDGMAHFTALRKGRTIGVIGSGLDIHYPSCNAYLYQKMEKEHLILSEYPAGTPVEKHHFPWRNRIIAALGQFLVVTQAALKSGTMITVNDAFALGKDVYAFPFGFMEDEGRGCGRLIFDGAQIIYEESVLKDLRPLHSACKIS